MNVARIPAELRALDQWVNWRLEERDGKLTKVPYQPNGLRADSTAPTTWSGFAACQQASSSIGFVVTEDDPYTGVDLDKVIDESGVIAPEAMRIVERLNSYTELTPSAAGLRVWVRARKPGPDCKRKLNGNSSLIEIYDQKRFFTMTGEHLLGTPSTIEDRQTELDALYHELFPPPAADPTWKEPTGHVDVDDQELLRRMFAADNGQKIERLWRGDTSAHPSPSEADAALAAHLAFWTDRDAGRMDALFRRSGLYREKWDSRRGEGTYGSQTIAKPRPYNRPGRPH
jgi:putative DNA primase/helicase